ncbi:Protein-glutamate O-methyltransferase SPCC1393.13 {ECO:0000250/UniProtKB:Q9H993} {ECO:0000250/UniProtKB:Q9H993} [Serendipita indica DSM 11827]|nr:Protein-glutamate O-methyltransferase SPCC1393.13 {ECO:0000250/UniProtKB:Q9H993} {ECO:0000250/UniProtKB:Q9H993} [Serendipita indica DSM 11827]
MSRYVPPVGPYDPRDPKGFSFDTVVRRWPVILTGVINDVIARQDVLRSDSNLSPQEQAAALDEGTEIIRRVSQIKSEMSRDYKMPEIEQDDGPSVDEFNRQLRELGEDGSWFKAPWLYAECYLYRLLRSYFAQTTYWHQHDPFLAQKNTTFRSSSAAIHKLAETLLDLQSKREELAKDEAALKTLFGEMLHMCLWGNATDLSLLTNMSHADIQKLQSVSKDEQAERAQFILRDDGAKAWEQLRRSRERVDMVLDNAGFELYTDLIFAEFLVSILGVGKVVFHPKAMPWFVSDVTPPDFQQTIAILQNAEEWSTTEQKTENLVALAKVAARFQQRVDEGIFELSVPLATKLGESVAGTEYDETFQELTSHFKGDLNYRKLTGDVKWPVNTTFSEALGPLRGSFPMLSLRTNKADVAVGIAEKVARELDEKGIAWRTSGKYALISFEPQI